MRAIFAASAALALIAFANAPASAADPCSPPVRDVREYVPGVYVVEYDFANANYLFVYRETNTVPGLQSHFDVGAGCTTTLEPDAAVFGTGGSDQPYVPLP